MIGLHLSLVSPPSGGAKASPDPFPTALMAAGGSYHHWAFEDAGTSWAVRHGNAMTLSRVGTPVAVDLSGVRFLDCATGCYEHQRDASLAAATPWSLWLLCSGRRQTGHGAYHGPIIGGANTTDTSALYFNAASRLFVGNTGYNASWTLPTAAGPESLEWSQPGGATASLAQVLAWRNGASLARAYLNNRATTATGRVVVLGGARNASGVSVPGGIQIRDAVLTTGWVLGAAQRAALESYRLARLAAA